MQLTKGAFLVVPKTPTELNALVSCLHSCDAFRNAHPFNGMQDYPNKLGYRFVVFVDSFVVEYHVNAPNTSFMTETTVNKLTEVLMNVG